MKYLLSLLLFITPLIAEELPLKVPGFAHPVLISLPTNFNPAKKHPTLFYYHGPDEKPSTEFMRKQAGEQNWIIVGMTYFKRGKHQLDSAFHIAEKTAFQHVREIMIKEHGTDPNKLFVSGFSKGGYHTELLLQNEPSIAGGIIIGAGHLYSAPKAISKHRFKKPIHIAVGQNDSTYPFALKAYMVHRKLGAEVTLEEWPNHGHRLPRFRSEALSQWFKMRTTSGTKIKALANEKIATATKKADYLEFPEQWTKLVELRQMPYFSRADSEIQKTLSTQLTLISKDPSVADEASLYSKRRVLLHREINSKDLLSLQKVALQYRSLANHSPESPQGKLLGKDADRLRKMLLTLQQRKVSAQKGAPASIPISPATTPTIPKNPVIR